MTDVQQRAAAKAFSEYWADKGYEKGESQPFWLSLLRDVYGVEHPEQYITFEDQVHLDHTSFIDGRIPETRVLIEQKGLDKDLKKPIKQSDGTLLTPFQQAKRYITELPVSQHPRWVVTCNFAEFLIYDMEHPGLEPEVLLLTDAVYSFPFISAKQTEQLVQKLQKQLSIHQRKRYRYLTIARQDRKTNNRQVFWNIEQLDEAIEQKKKVKLSYLHYGLDKKQHETKSYTLSPYEMVYMNEHYYLICVPDHASNTRLYRIDRMKDIQILDEPRSEAVARQEAQNAVYAYVGAPERIVMYCDRCDTF